MLPAFTALNVSPLEPIASAEPVAYKPLVGLNVDVPNLANTSTLVTAFAGVTLPSAIVPLVVRTYPANNPLYVAYNLDVTASSVVSAGFSSTVFLVNSIWYVSFKLAVFTGRAFTVTFTFLTNVFPVF